MKRAAADRRPPPSQLRASLVGRLQARRTEIEQAVLARAYSLADPAGVGDPRYVEGLRASVAIAIDYGLAAIEAPPGRPQPVPAELLTQARQAARHGVSLDTVLRRYFAGHALLGDFIMQEAEADSSFGAGTLHCLTRRQAELFDHLIARVSAEYQLDVEAGSRSLRQRHAISVRKLLAGELIDPHELGYELDAWHIGIALTGNGAEQVTHDLGDSLDSRVLRVANADGLAWAWLGTNAKPGRDRIEAIGGWGLPPQVSMSFGEPGHGLDGWRLTHRQAIAALPVALQSPGATVRYADVGLLASILQDDVLARSLSNLYLEPLGKGADLRKTLRAYFAAQRNVSSAAAALGVSRHTVTKRLRIAEERLGRQLASCAPEVETALRLEELNWTHHNV